MFKIKVLTKSGNTHTSKQIEMKYYAEYEFILGREFTGKWNMATNSGVIAIVVEEIESIELIKE